MHPAIRELIDHTRFQRRLIVDIAALLPAEDAELDRWIGEAIQRSDQSGFFYLVLAGLHAERPVDSRHLDKGTMMIQHDSWVGCIAWRMQGEVAEHLLVGMQNTTLNRAIRTSALFAAGAWCNEKRAGIMSPSLITESRRLAREEKLDDHSKAMLYALAAIAKDEGLNAVIAKSQKVPPHVVIAASTKLAEETIQTWRAPIIDQVPDTPRPQTVQGFTMRRAVARISRNDPCPCGSGKKYKRCCYEKDQERLRHSSDISGKTDLEVRADLEQHLTETRLAKLPAYEVARLDPAKINPALLEKYFWTLIAYSLFDRAAEAFEQLGYQPERHQVWVTVLWEATAKGHREVIHRLARLHPDAGTSDEHLYPATAIILLEDDPAKMLDLVNEIALSALEENTAKQMYGFAWSLLLTKFHVLGIYIARSMIPLLPKKEALQLLEHIFETRDRLNLPPDDPYSDILDRRFADEVADDGKDAGALREARKKLEAKAAEVRKIKDDLEQLRREVEHREKNRPAAAAAPSASPPADEKRLQELRDKVTELKSVLQGRHEERSTLRRELQQAHTDLETLRQKQSPQPSHPGTADKEDALLLPGDVSGHQPVRLLEFPRKFHDTLSGLPRQVARGAMTMLGRLAAGEPAAYVGVVRLKDCPETLRQRIGIDHRLLFRLHPDHLEVIDLINRRDLERRIKTLV